MFTKEFCLKKRIERQRGRRDENGTRFADITIDGKSLCEELLRVGLAWHDRKYNKDEKLAELECEAREAKLGLWESDDPIEPWEWKSSRQDR